MNPAILDLHIHPAAGDRFSLEFVARGSSEPLARAEFDFPISSTTEFEIGALDFNPRSPQGRIERLRAFGQRLYRKLFSPDVEADVEAVWREWKTREGLPTLCVRIAPEAARLESLPWEALHDGEEFLAAGARTTLSRLPLDIAPRPDPEPIPFPLRMLALVSSPIDLGDQGRLQMEFEQEILLKATNDPAARQRLYLEFEDEAKREVIEESFDAPWHILHYTGHGYATSDESGLVLEDANGHSRYVNAEEVVQSLERGLASMRLAVLSGCQTAKTQQGFGDLARRMARRIPAVIAMQFSISDDGGLKLAETLYPALVEGEPLESSVHTVRRALWLSEDPVLQADALAIVLMTASGACLRGAHGAGDPASSASPRIDFSFHLPLAQHGYGFYGRRREYREIRDGLLHRNQRAVVIHALGGIGKTSLASHAAHRLREHFRGVYAFDCRGGALSPERIVLDLHRYLARNGVNALEQLTHQSLLPSFQPAELAQYVAQVLSQWPMLLVFDNFEDHLERAETGHRIHCIRDPGLREFLTTLVKTTATGTRFLFTSRYLFDVDEKRLGNIQSLALRDLYHREAMMLMQKLPNLAAASYFDKLRAYKKFGGHPYALVTLDRFCAHEPLERALDNVKPVEDELRAFLAIELNYGRINAFSRELLNRIAAFREPVLHAAAEWVMGTKVNSESESQERHQSEPLDAPIAELIEWGLLMPVAEDGQAQSLSVHNLVRDFCRDQQPGEPWRERLREAAAFYISRTKLLGEYDKTPAAVWSEMEAFELLMEAEEFRNAASLLGDAHPPLDRWGFGRYLENQYLRLLDKLDVRDCDWILHNLAVLMQYRGEYDAALRQYQQSLAIFEELGNRAGVASSLHQIGNLYCLRGDYDAALRQYQQSLAIEEELGDRAGVASSLHQIGVIHESRGEYDAALQQYQQSLAIFEELGDHRGMASSLHQIGNLQYLRGEYDAALWQYQQSLAIEEELGDRAGVASSLHQIGMIHESRGEYDAALWQYQQSLAIREELGDRAGVASLLHAIGNLQYFRGEYDAALQQYQQSLAIKEGLGDRAGVASSLHQMGMIHESRGEYDAALRQYQQSLAIKEGIGDHRGMASSLHQIGNLQYLRGEYDAALWQYQQSLAIFEELGDRAGVASSLHQIGMIHQSRGEYDAALRQYQQSLAIREGLGDCAGMASSLHQMGMIHQSRGEYDAALWQYQQSLAIFEELGARAGMASSHGQIGNLQYLRGEYDAALWQYQQSLAIFEELGGRVGAASSHGQIGKLLTKLGKYREALDHLLFALAAFAELQSPYARLAVNDLKTLRTVWGAQGFDAAWREAANSEPPDWLQ